MILSENGLSGWLKRLLDLVFIGGSGIILTLPWGLSLAFQYLHPSEDENYYYLLIFLYASGLLALMIVHQLRKIFQTLNKRNPFIMENVKSFKIISTASFIIAAIYMTKVVFFISILTVVITMLFIIIALFSLVLSEVFRQATIVKEENDLTI